MHGFKRNSYDNHSPIRELESQSKSSNTSNRHESSASDQGIDDSLTLKSIKTSQEKLSVSVNDVYSLNENIDDLSNSSDGGTARSIISSVPSDQKSDSKSSSHQSQPAKLSSSDIYTPFRNSSPVPKDEVSDNHFAVDGLANVSPGSISQESNLFPDNLSRSSESNKSVECGNLRSQEKLSKSELAKIEKALKCTDKKEKEKKKSSWYNRLNPSYKSKSDDFRRLFKELPDSERLIVDYACALQRDILIQGRLYVSQNYICFYANIFRWETFVLVRCRDVTSMTKEKTARVIPNAIQITTETEKHFFTSFTARDKTFLLLFRIWQNALLEQPMSSQELWQFVHQSYGDELGLTSDDDDYVAPPALEDTLKSSKSLDPNILKDAEKSLDKSLGIVPLDIASDILDEIADISAESLGGLGGSCEQLILEAIDDEITQRDNDIALEHKVSENPTDMSDTTDSEEDMEDAEVICPCSSHEGKELLNAVFPMSVDQIFNLVFTGSKFYYDLLASRKTYDIMDSPWQVCPEAGLKMRQISYTVTLNHSMAKSAHTTETQRLLKHSKSGHVYTIDCDVVNTGIPYCDTFMVKSVYCITRVSKRECRLRVFGCVHYKKKPMWGLISSLIEKSAMQGLADYATDLEAALTKEAECSSQQGSNKKHRRHKRMKIDPGKCDNLKDAPRILQRQPTLRKIGQSISGFDLGRVGNNPDLVVVVILVTLLVLLFLNMLLFYKLWSLEDPSPKPVSTPTWEFSAESLSSMERDDVLQLLKKQDMLHRTETEKWRDALTEIMKLIHLVEASLSDLRNSIDFYSSSSVLKSIPLRNSHGEMPSSSAGGAES